MKRKMMTVVMAVAVMAAAGNVCNAQETEAASDGMELAELVLVDEADAVEWGLSEQQFSEIYAYAAYNISENYLKPNDISSDSIAIADLGEWGMARQYMGDLICHGMINAMAGVKETESSADVINDEIQKWDTLDDPFLRILDESIFAYCYCIDGYDFTLFDIGDLIEGISALIDAAEENLIFSDEQLKLGEAVAQELEEAEAN